MSNYIRGNFQKQSRNKAEDPFLKNSELMREIQLKGSFVLIEGEVPLVVEGKEDE